MAKPSRRNRGSAAGATGTGTRDSRRQSNSAARRKATGGRTWRHLGWYAAGTLVVVGGVFLMMRPGSSHSPLAGNDFRVVAYQREEVFGGPDGKLSSVLKQGKPVVLNFFAGQCPPCRLEMPGFQRSADHFAGKVIFVGVDIGPYLNLGTHDDARRLLKELNVTYAAGYAPDNGPLNIFSIRGMPTTVIYDAKAQLASSNTGVMTEDQLSGVIQPLLSN
ncbi:MAG: hypothetical protein NVS3B24_21990 [Candidatus Dormibacteria bacterium]